MQNFTCPGIFLHGGIGTLHCVMNILFHMKSAQSRYTVLPNEGQCGSLNAQLGAFTTSQSTNVFQI